jgi:hypothetical protein
MNMQNKSTPPFMQALEYLDFWVRHDIHLTVEAVIQCCSVPETALTTILIIPFLRNTYN